MPYACAFVLFLLRIRCPFFFRVHVHARVGAWGADAGHVAVAVGAWQGSSKGPSAQGYRAQPRVGDMGVAVSYVAGGSQFQGPISPGLPGTVPGGRHGFSFSRFYQGLSQVVHFSQLDTGVHPRKTWAGAGGAGVPGSAAARCWVVLHAVHVHVHAGNWTLL